MFALWAAWPAPDLHIVLLCHRRRRLADRFHPATAVTNAGLLQATDLRSVDYKAWQPEVLEAIGLYHAYIRWYNR